MAEEQLRLTRERIAAAAMEVVARQGFDATVEAIAEASGVSPRTVFRHYRTHDQLIVATVRDMFEACGRRPIDGLVPPEVDLDQWLDGLALTIHTRNAEILGEAFWDIHAVHDQAQAPLAEVDALRRRHRVRGVGYLTELAWRTAGGAGEAPHDLLLAFALNFSAFTTKALMVDFDQSPAQIARITAHTLKTLLRRAVERQDRPTTSPSAASGEQAAPSRSG